ncbi:MAG: PQQ-dependent sugar dehydrogenase [Gemmatimonadaceae bacterium]|nr:PQQ-dependent sugar dehydrogenase [Gemmatimonadaceae bacterium]
MTLTRRSRLLHVLPLALLSACGNSTGKSDPLPNDPGPGTVPTLSRVTVMTGLSNPWDVAFSANGTMFFTERCAGLSVRFADGTVTRLFGTNGSSLVASDLSCEGQSGMNGVALDPAFASNRRLYVYMASTLSSPRTNRVVRLILGTDLKTASQRTDIITDIPFKHVGTANGGAGAHSGGRIRFGPDGLLYVTTGDNHNRLLPQSPTLLGGKVLRVTADGAAASGNNAPSGFDRRVFTFGHRNVQGISFRPGTGQPFTGEHGPNHTDEVTALVNGGNAGWDPQNRSALNCPDGYCGYSGNPSTMPMTDVARFPDAMRAAWINNGASQGMGPVEFLSGTQWGIWNGRLAVGLMGGSRVEILDLDTSGSSTSNTNSGLPSVRYRSLVQGPDGNLYAVTDSGEIWKVTPSI